MRPGGAFHWRDLAPEVGPAEPRAGSRAWDAGMAWALARRPSDKLLLWSCGAVLSCQALGGQTCWLLPSNPLKSAGRREFLQLRFASRLPLKRSEAFPVLPQASGGAGNS